MYRRLQKTVLFPIGRDSLFYCFFFLDIVYYLYIILFFFKINTMLVLIGFHDTADVMIGGYFQPG